MYVYRLIQSGTKTEEQIESETPLLGVPLPLKGNIGVKVNNEICVWFINNNKIVTKITTFISNID